MRQTTQKDRERNAILIFQSLINFTGQREIDWFEYATHKAQAIKQQVDIGKDN
jgi:hypothetical protein